MSALLLFSSTAFAAEQLVLISTRPEVDTGTGLQDQLADWKQSGMIEEVQLFESEPGEEPLFHFFGILRFSDESALQAWSSAADKALDPSVRRTEVDLLAELGSSPYTPSGSVFMVMQYDVFVDRVGFEGYIAGYQLPEMEARETHGGLVRYSSFYARPGESAPWQSLIIMEYKDAEEYEESKTLNGQLGAELALKDERFSELKRTKHSLRNKTGTTRANWIELPQPTATP